MPILGAQCGFIWVIPLLFLAFFIYLIFFRRIGFLSCCKGRFDEHYHEGRGQSQDSKKEIEELKAEISDLKNIVNKLEEDNIN